MSGLLRRSLSLAGIAAVPHIAWLAAAGCGGREAGAEGREPLPPGIRGDAGIGGKLAAVGLELMGEDEANVPKRERGKFVPCRVVGRGHRGGRGAVVEPHPAGYLIVGVGREAADIREDAGAAEITRAIAAWRPGETLTLRFRLNPYLSDEAVSYQADVPVKLPER